MGCLLSEWWLQARWSPAQAVQSILWKELFAIVNSVNTWGHQWAKQKMSFHCDNKAVVDIWCKGSTRDPGTMALRVTREPWHWFACCIFVLLAIILI